MAATGGIGLVWCPLCGWMGASFGPGPNGRPNACCVRCGSLERHRFLAVLLHTIPAAEGGERILDVAPMQATAALFRERCGPGYVGIDVDPGADRRKVTTVASLTGLPFADHSFDLQICYHVLEHIPDDAAALAEMRRVLTPGGAILMQVPWRPGPTDEDPSLPPEERVVRFGQADHVRYYGDDIADRLSAAGFDALVLTASDLLPDELCRLMGVIGEERVWRLTESGVTSDRVMLEQLRSQAPEAVQAAVQRLNRVAEDNRLQRAEKQRMRRERDKARSTARRWRRRYRRLRSKRAVRIVTRLSGGSPRGKGSQAAAQGGPSSDNR